MTHTKGEWRKVYVSGVCFGVGVKNDPEDSRPYTQMICNTILPETDKDYEVEKGEIESNMNLVRAAPDMYEAIQSALNIEELWAPAECEAEGESVSEEHMAEMEALSAMHRKFKQALQKAKGEE